MLTDSPLESLGIIWELNDVPIVSSDDCLKVALEVMTTRKLGFCLILDQDQTLIAVLSDGDLRRLLLNVQAPLPSLLIAPAKKFATANPISFPVNGNPIELKKLFIKHRVHDIPLTNDSLQVIGVVTALDILSIS